MPTAACQRKTTAASWSTRARSPWIVPAALRISNIPTPPLRELVLTLPRYEYRHECAAPGTGSGGDALSGDRDRPQRRHSLSQLPFDDAHVHEGLRERPR